VGSSLVDMYANCGSIMDSWRVFHKLPSQYVIVTGTATILGRVNAGKGRSNVPECFFASGICDVVPLGIIHIWTSYESRNLVKSFYVLATCLNN
jgi:hypothetical protein